MGTYLYAVVAGEHRLELGKLGIPDGQTQVMTLPASCLAAVVSKYDGPAFGDLPKTDLLRRLAFHQGVIERAMADHPVIPVKFGTVLDSNSEVSKVLDRWQIQLAGALTELGNAIEIEVAATWDLKETFATIACQPEIASLGATIAGRPADETMATRIQIGQLVKEALDLRREEYHPRIAHHLLPIAREAKANPLLADEMVLNLAFLVERAELDGFYARVHDLDAAFENQLTFRCIGPLPPYSFVTVEISKPGVDKIEAARRLLGLGDRVSENEISERYRRLAFQCHPDRNPDDPAATERFGALTAAYDLLATYVRAKSAGPGQGEEQRRLKLVTTVVEDALVLKIVRSKSQPVPSAEESYEHNHAVV